LCRQGYVQPYDGWRLSLGGTSLLALNHFLETHPEITHIYTCTDNDEPGNIAAEKIVEAIRNKSALPGIKERAVCQRAPPIYGTDWNDTLQIMQKMKRLGHTQSQMRNNDAHSL
jgi:hypothetical protein